jgi:hypothetical protein
MEKGKTREACGGHRNCKNLILLTKIKLENNFLYPLIAAQGQNL